MEAGHLDWRETVPLSAPERGGRSARQSAVMTGAAAHGARSGQGAQRARGHGGRPLQLADSRQPQHGCTLMLYTGAHSQAAMHRYTAERCYTRRYRCTLPMPAVLLEHDLGVMTIRLCLNRNPGSAYSLRHLESFE